MNRYVEQDLKLSDGTVLPKGSRVMVMSNFADPVVYPDPDKFDPTRFMRMREQPGQESSWQFVTTSPQHLLFGHGQHACPGRFFAANEIKIALCHLLLKYDWRFLPGQGRPDVQRFEITVSVNTKTKVQVRRRDKEALDLL